MEPSTCERSKMGFQWSILDFEGMGSRCRIREETAVERLSFSQSVQLRTRVKDGHEKRSIAHKREQYIISLYFISPLLLTFVSDKTVGT